MSTDLTTTNTTENQPANLTGAEESQEPERISYAEFLENVPPSQLRKIDGLTSIDKSRNPTLVSFLFPEIQVHCSNDNCNGLRFFRQKNYITGSLGVEGLSYYFLLYICSNCQKTEKIFSISVKKEEKLSPFGEGYKFGELPTYGPPTPPRLITLIGPDRELFLKGRQCENQGLGVGAFVYYRRVVENQKNRILKEIIKVSEKVGAPSEVITTLQNAVQEPQFSKALASVRDAIPQALLINGQNPLTLLHRALSDGLHDRTDEQCLGIAHAVRVVLAELSERLGQILKDEQELTSAVSRLMKVKQEQ